ncbi:MAG: hypothetical protein KAI29_31720 [Cyclobacteriaceae bacterium]|nr:hypothetical protein [Cyclobacteriaceae bacterium]
MNKAAVFTSGLVLFIILFYMISGLFLTYNKPVKSPYVLLEDWISYTIAEDASNYIFENNIDSVFVVGMKNSNTSVSLHEIDKTEKLKKNGNIYAMYWGGILGFEIPSEKLNESFTLNIKMRGTSYTKHFPHYEIFLNRQLIGTGFINEKDSVYKFILSKNISDSVAYLLINFDNDRSGPTGDRNLYIADIYIDSMGIDSLTRDNFFIPNTAEPNINYVSKLNTIKYYLADLGFDSSKVKLVEVDYDPFNKSLALAKGAKKYFRKTEVKNINIFTANIHSRRSYLNFKNCLDENIELGCIPGNGDIRGRTSLYEGFDERISLLLTWIYWWFH